MHLKQLHMESMREMTSGVGLPGLDEAFEKLSGAAVEADEDDADEDDAAEQ